MAKEEAGNGQSPNKAKCHRQALLESGQDSRAGRFARGSLSNPLSEMGTWHGPMQHQKHRVCLIIDALEMRVVRTGMDGTLRICTRHLPVDGRGAQGRRGTSRLSTLYTHRRVAYAAASTLTPNSGVGPHVRPIGPRPARPRTRPHPPVAPSHSFFRSRRSPPRRPSSPLQLTGTEPHTPSPTLVSAPAAHHDRQDCCILEGGLQNKRFL